MSANYLAIFLGLAIYFSPCMVPVGLSMSGPLLSVDNNTPFVVSHEEDVPWEPFLHGWFSDQRRCQLTLNTLRPRQDGCHFPDDIFRCIFLNENIWIAINISLSFVPKGPIDNIPALAQIMAWRRPGDKPLSETMMVILLTHICVTRPQWVKQQGYFFSPQNLILFSNVGHHR